ncbi:uncharacterized protein LOC105641698 isoform X2 [Jatropha curcas]|uniref:uncharacterized protein LOC105641698 isoform X2 n=1 Tax=Jatropha curcas TaxID=180498 RepID=UPI0005FC043B|nr:uncharacterized protein LOC105641698 isoform X2 [Jatropha curcas]
MSLLGDDGRGFELARKLETLGVWRAWLGDSLYSTFIHFLSSPSSWDSFMRTDDSKSRPRIQLQLRVRALLFDKASVSLFVSSNNSSASSSSVAVSKLNPYYLQLHGDDVYFTLEDGDQRREGGGGGVGSNAAPSKSHSKSAFGTGSRYGDSEMDSVSQRFRVEEFPETWYNQFIEKHKASRPYRLSFADRESEKRSPEEMCTYLKLIDKHKRRRVAFTPSMHPSSGLDGSNSIDDDISFFPETMFMSNCVPDSALPLIIRQQGKEKIEFHGVLDTLPQTRSSVVIERLGISVEQGGSLHRVKNGSEGNRKLLGQEQASHLSQKVVARMLEKVGFESATEVPVEVLSQLLRCHISKLGSILKVFADSYRKQCSAIDLLKMFLQKVGYSNLGILMELVKDGTRNVVQPTQQQIHGIQSQLQPQHQSTIRLPQQIPRQMHPQMQQMVHPQTLTFQQQQQQLERVRRRQQSAPRPVMDMDKDRPLVQVKLENPPELPMDGNSFNPMHSRHPQMQYRQQQLAAMSNLQAQSSSQFRQLTSVQVPQMQTPNMGIVRAPPVKVEGFQELMGGDASLKHDSEENKLTSPSK